MRKQPNSAKNGAQIKQKLKINVTTESNKPKEVTNEEHKTPKVGYGERTPRVRLDISSETIIKEAKADAEAEQQRLLNEMVKLNENLQSAEKIAQEKETENDRLKKECEKLKHAKESIEKEKENMRDSIMTLKEQLESKAISVSPSPRNVAEKMMEV